MKIVQLAPGHHGVRQLSSALATVRLRKQGYLPQIVYFENGKGKPWTDEEYDEAIVMRLRGMSHDEIAKALGRTKPAIDRQLGHEAPKRGSYAVTA